MMRLFQEIFIGFVIWYQLLRQITKVSQLKRSEIIVIKCLFWEEFKTIAGLSQTSQTVFFLLLQKFVFPFQIWQTLFISTK